MTPAMALLSPDDEAWFRAAHVEAKRIQQTWEDRSIEVTKKHGGEWVAFLGETILAHDRDPERLRLQLDQLGKLAELALVRFVPPADWEFAF